MVGNVSFDPYAMSNAAGSFSIQSEGYVQGVALDDPAIRNELAGGYLASTETLPMWGGIAIFEDVALAESAGGVLQGKVGRATQLSQITGFSVFNQAVSMQTSPNSPVPTAGPGRSVNFFRLGSGIRIPVACDPSLISLRGGLITQQVSWDYNNQVLQPYDASTATIAASSTVTWASTGGGQLTFPVANWTGAFQPGAGDIVNVSGATNSGTGGTAAINANFIVVSSTSTQAILSAPAAAGVFGTIGGSPVINFGVGALPVKVLGLNVGNSMTVNYDPVNNVATWNRSGTTAVIVL